MVSHLPSLLADLNALQISFYKLEMLTISILCSWYRSLRLPFLSFRGCFQCVTCFSLRCEKPYYLVFVLLQAQTDNVKADKTRGLIPKNGGAALNYLTCIQP